MKRLLLGAVAAAAMATPALANDMSGSITLGYESTEYDSGGEYDGYALGGDFIYTLNNGWDLQLDGRSVSQDWECCNGNYSQSYVATHLSADMGNFDIGGFAGLMEYYDDSGVVLGVEGRTGFGNLNLDGSIALTDFGDNGYDGTAYRAGAAFFFMPNLALTGGASLTTVNASGNDTDITELMIGGAYQFHNNIELFAGYTNADYDWEFGGDNESDTIEVGLRFNLNRGTLQENAANGAWSSAEHVNDTWMRW